MPKKAKKKTSRDARHFHTGYDDNLEPLEPLDLAYCSSVSDMLEGMKKTAFTGRCLGEAADVLYEMVIDPDCFIVLTISGAMTVAKMGLVVCDMIDRSMINCIVSTGALMAHGLVEATGRAHFKYNTEMDDKKLYEYGYDRVYDTLELENNLNDVEVYVQKILTAWRPEKTLCSHTFLRAIGELLHNDFPKNRAILKSAYEKKVPVFVPAFSDSELGLDFGIHNRMQVIRKKEKLRFDPFLDLDAYTDMIIRSKRIGIITIGGGVPRNWAQQVGPYLDIMSYRSNGEINVPMRRFHYGVRICPEPVQWGGLSGCTYSEGVSWGKFVPAEEGGRFSEVLVDATIGWPLLVRAVMDRAKKNKVKLSRSKCFEM